MPADLAPLYSAASTALLTLSQRLRALSVVTGGQFDGEAALAWFDSGWCRGGGQDIARAIERVMAIDVAVGEEEQRRSYPIHEASVAKGSVRGALAALCAVVTAMREETEQRREAEGRGLAPAAPAQLPSPIDVATIRCHGLLDPARTTWIANHAQEIGQDRALVADHIDAFLSGDPEILRANLRGLVGDLRGMTTPTLDTSQWTLLALLASHPAGYSCAVGGPIHSLVYLGLAERVPFKWTEPFKDPGPGGEARARELWEAVHHHRLTTAGKARFVAGQGVR
jgi:hypothetical protein